MRYWVDFCNYKLNGELGSVCGSDGVYLLDGRWGRQRQHDTAAMIARSRGFPAYRIMSGKRFYEPSHVGETIRLD